jgi:tartrate dehydrogenase/decarboxylase/D-malate dehydrogenase
MKKYRIAAIQGDGIGKEVLPEGIRVIDAAAGKAGIQFEWDQFPWSCGYYKETGRMMPEDGLQQIRHHDAIFLGAVGFPDVPDHVSLWGLLIPIRRVFEQYANIRPVKLMPGIQSPLRNRECGDIDFIIVRENNEGEYSSVGGRMFEGTEFEFAIETASKRTKKLVTSATKSNGITITMPFWDERFKAISAEYPLIKTNQFHIDILTAHFVLHPDRFDVVVGSNLFGDILSDLGPACTGTIGIAPSANLNPERAFPSMFEPVHGSAPDIAGKGIANPIGQIWSGAMMLEHLGELDAATAIVKAIEKTLETGPKTRDVGGSASTEEVGKAIAAAV